MRRRGRFERRHRLPRLHGARLVLTIVCAVLTALSVWSFALFSKETTALLTQSAADTWRGESEDRFAQVSVFLPVDGTKTLDDIRMFRQSLEDAFVRDSMEAPEGGSLYTDAYSGQTSLSVSSASGSSTVTAIGVGGDFFLFHPLPLRSGSYLTGEDYMADRVVLDEQTAWALFGSSDAAGMEVTINGVTYPVAGVVAREDDHASRAALTAEDAQNAKTATALVFMSYEALNNISETPIDCYEIVLPDPVSGYGKKLVSDNFSAGNGAIVQNTDRYSVPRLWTVLTGFGTRVMSRQGVIYPYWENAARMTETYAALYLLLGVLFALMPVVCLVIVLVKLVKREVQRAAYSAAHAIEEKVEENKRKHYVKGGI